jgi:hypothetical protein
MNTLLLRSPRATGGSGSVSALRADSRGTGVAPGADGGGVRERDAAVRCSAVCTVRKASSSTRIRPVGGRSEQGDDNDATYPCWMTESAVVRRSICLTGDDIRRGTRVRVSPIPYHSCPTSMSAWDHRSPGKPPWRTTPPAGVRIGPTSRRSPLGGAGGSCTGDCTCLPSFEGRGMSAPVPTPSTRPAAKRSDGPSVGIVSSMIQEQRVDWHRNMLPSWVEVDSGLEGMTPWETKKKNRVTARLVWHWPTSPRTPKSQPSVVLETTTSR